MTRLHNRLTAIKVQRAKKPGLYADGGNLYLRVAEGGSKQWMLRYEANGHVRDMSLGPVHTLTLAEARERARLQRLLRLDGIDPIQHRRAQEAAQQVAAARAMTFEQCARGFLKDNEAEWKNPKHRQQWKTTLSQYVFPTMGPMPVAAIDTPIVLQVIKPLWERIPVTAKRVLGRIENVLGWATAHHYRAGDNPARWSGLLEHVLPSPSKVARVEHHTALPYAEVAGFLAKLDTSVAAYCARFIVLTATRRGEAINATWDEIDLDRKIWTIPPRRMKAGREHRIPLSAAAVAVLKRMHSIRRSDYVFPGTRQGRPIGETAMEKIAANRGITLHGFRSAFRDWAAETTAFPNHLAEQALAHAIPNAVEAAYRRGDLFEKRRRLMDAWAEYCRKQNGAGAVVPLRGAS